MRINHKVPLLTDFKAVITKLYSADGVIPKTELTSEVFVGGMKRFYALQSFV